MEIKDLVALLEAHSIPLSKWGVGEAKTVDHLLKEVRSGEVELVSENGVLFKVGSIAAVDVYYRDGDTTLKLWEEKQVFSDGRERRRPNTYGGLVEKMLPGENCLTGASRALREELGIESEVEIVLKQSFLDDTGGSMSYPGIRARHTVYLCEVQLPECFYKPEGYVEEQSDKKSYFIWVKAQQKGE